MTSKNNEPSVRRKYVIEIACTLERTDPSGNSTGMVNGTGTTCLLC